MDLHLNALETPQEVRFDFVVSVEVITTTDGPLCRNRWQEFFDSAELD